MSSPRVSVIMPAYNRERYIAEAIRSVLSQSFDDIELVIIDDGSTDRTLEIAESFADDPRAQIVKNNKNLGIARTRNRGLELAKAEYIALLDSDDVWLDREKLDKQVKFLDEHSDYAMVGGAIAHINTESQRLKEVSFPQTDAELREIILQFNPFPQSTLAYRKSVIMAAGGYSADYKVCDDYALWLRVGLNHRFANFGEVFTGYRIHGGNITRTKRLTAAREILEIVRENASRYPHHHRGIAKAYLRLLYAYMRT